jgi:hypothetical protein
MSYKDVISLKQYNMLKHRDGVFLFYNDSGCGKCQEILKECSKLSPELKSKLILVSISHFNSDFLNQNLNKLPFLLKFENCNLLSEQYNVKSTIDILTALEF